MPTSWALLARGPPRTAYAEGGGGSCRGLGSVGLCALGARRVPRGGRGCIEHAKGKPVGERGDGLTAK